MTLHEPPRLKRKSAEQRVRGDRTFLLNHRLEGISVPRGYRLIDQSPPLDRVRAPHLTLFRNQDPHLHPYGYARRVDMVREWTAGGMYPCSTGA